MCLLKGIGRNKFKVSGLIYYQQEPWKVLLIITLFKREKHGLDPVLSNKRKSKVWISTRVSSNLIPYNYYVLTLGNITMVIIQGD